MMTREQREQLEDQVYDMRPQLDMADIQSMSESELLSIIDNVKIIKPKPARLITIETKPRTLAEKFRYDPESGNLYNVKGEVAGKINYGNGYSYIHHDGKTISCHRVAWYLMKGYFPEVQVYHLNGDKLDNRWSNLGLLRNQSKKTHRARVRDGGRIISLGYFATAAEAEAAKTFFKESAKKG